VFHVLDSQNAARFARGLFAELAFMSALSVTIRQGKPAVVANDSAALLSLIAEAASESEKVGRACIIDAVSERGDVLSLVVGGTETVLGFTPADNEPPYFASRGQSSSIEPLFTCYLHFEHHTEFPRHAVIPYELGLAAALQFLQTGERPSIVQWQEV
jgi:hypothetical protein